MGKQKPDGIPWCDFTFNPWQGCQKVSPACDDCYAWKLDIRWKGGKHWGKDAPRLFFGESHWAQPHAWNRAAEKAGKRARVFCGSMCDVMEEREDLQAARASLYVLIENTPHLDWLLLTKRPQNFRRFLPLSWLSIPQLNVWLMTTIESPEYYWRWAELRKVPATIRGVSYEPALSPISLNDMSDQGWIPDWLICGDESGSKARLSQLEWYESLRDECERFGVAFHMKQLCTKGKPMDFPMFPEGLQIRAFPEVPRA